MTGINISPKIRSWFEKIQAETSKPIGIELVPANQIGPGMKASFRPDPNEIIIALPQGIPKLDDSWEHSIAHELTHGVLLHSRKYHYPEIKQHLTNEKRHLISLVLTMIDDIVVNKMISEEGAQPFSKHYIPEVKREIKSMNKGVDHYSEPRQIGPTFHSKFRIFRYVMAWGFLKYFSISPENRKILSRFVKIFERTFRDEYHEAKKITALISENDIFTVEGHLTVLDEISRMWGFAEKIDLVTFK